ncbi:dATP/dGTP pyrophosphohydrolase domain-containing protein [Paraburkholderia agricolaris]|uniref:dATP/dGTP pyrophosphohydrolase domain-containing protein n=1 Tax=Paraburkholderia agricolaris TaxID=2152888 RepID=UPI001292AB0E|nr:dATP/dGTP pyrophosphohydrolase domain-containing protein [Paraburkholderia agricolaris]
MTQQDIRATREAIEQRMINIRHTNRRCLCTTQIKRDQTMTINTDAVRFDILAHLQRQRDWSERPFGPGPRTKGLVDHIRKELCEIEAEPTDIPEWIDFVVLALDGAWRAGASPGKIVDTIVAKQAKNEGRVWPDWRTTNPDKAIEHTRAADTWPMAGDIVRYENGSTALARLISPHAGGWHGYQCMRATTFLSKCYRPSAKGLRMWDECAKWRKPASAAVASSAVNPITE